MFRTTFANRAINLLNLHFGLHAFADQLGYVFTGVYFYQIGLPLSGIFGVWAATFLLRALVRPLAVRLCFRTGVRWVLISGALLFSLMYPLMGMIRGIDIWLFIFIGAVAVIDVLYWFPYHAYFSVLGDAETRGKQVGVREILVTGALFLAPVVGGILINTVGFFSAFLVAGACALLAAVPLFFTPEIPLGEKYTLREAFYRVGKEGFWLFSAWSFYFQFGDFIWKLVLFIFLSNYVSFGGILSLALVFQAVGMFTIGHRFDRGGSKKICFIGLLLTTFVLIARIFLSYTIPLLIFLDILFMLAYSLYYPVLNSAFYNTGKKSHHPLWFQFFSETGWDVGAIASMILAMGLIELGVDLRLTMVFGLIGLWGMGWFLRRYFREE